MIDDEIRDLYLELDAATSGNLRDFNTIADKIVSYYKTIERIDDDETTSKRACKSEIVRRWKS